MPLPIKTTLFILFLSITITATTQTPTDTASIIGTGQRAIPKPMLDKPDPLDTSVSVSTKKAYYNALTAYYNAIEKKNLTDAKTIDSVGSYYTWALKNRQSIIQRQQITGTLIFVLVTILLLSGLVFSALQFRIALKNVKTTFKASLAGIEVSSSILGVIILAISLGFFYLYLTNVYPLVSLDQLPPQTPGK